MSTKHSSAEAFGRLAAELQAAESVELTVETVVQFALQAVWCDYASVVLITKGRRPEVMALTDPKLAELYRHQIDARSGPMLTAIEERVPLLIPDVATETRWSPQWTEQMLAAGIRSAMHLPLLVADRPEAVLALYSVEPDGFSDDDLDVAHVLAQHSSAAIAAARKAVNLTHAVDARRLIGAAMGILMERYQLDEPRAFEVLRRYSMDNNRKLRDVAEELIDTRNLPAAPADSRVTQNPGSATTDSRHGT